MTRGAPNASETHADLPVCHARAVQSRDRCSHVSEARACDILGEVAQRDEPFEQVTAVEEVTNEVHLGITNTPQGPLAADGAMGTRQRQPTCGGAVNGV